MSVSRIFSATCALAAVVSLVSLGNAQERRGPDRGGDRGGGGRGGFGFGGGGGGGGGPGGGGMDAFTLLRNEGIQKELEIGDDQQRALSDLRDQMRREEEELQRRIREQYQAKIDEVLLPHQAERIQQITLQLRGVDALLDPKVSKELALTEAQLGKLRTMRDEQRQQLGGGGPGGPGGPGGGPGGPGGPAGGADFQERMQQFRERREQQEAAMLAVLTPPQKAKFEELKGAAFDRSTLGFGGGRGGPGGPGGGGPGGGGPGGGGGFRGRPGN